jgi:hypothetical protein
MVLARREEPVEQATVRLEQVQALRALLLELVLAARELLALLEEHQAPPEVLVRAREQLRQAKALLEAPAVSKRLQ